jgi:hypothetical protein
MAPHFYNTEDEVDGAMAIMAEVVSTDNSQLSTHNSGGS